MPYVRTFGFVTLLQRSASGAAGITPPDQAFRFQAQSSVLACTLLFCCLPDDSQEHGNVIFGRPMA